VSDTNPLPAQELLALADAMMGAASHLICQSDVAEPIEEFANESAVQDTIEAYRAARAASPVTLEEALCAEQAGCCDLCNNEPANVEIACSQYIDAMLSVEEQGRTINARRLAGEGGAK